MNVIERNYLPKLGLRDTQEAIAIIEDELMRNLEEGISFIKVRQPMISSEKVALSSTKESGNRQINFDSSNDNNIYHIYDEFRYWLLDVVKKLEIKNNNSIATIANYIERDTQIKNTQSFEKKKLFIEYRYDSEDQELVYQKSYDLNKILLNAIKRTQEKIIRLYPVLSEFQLPEVVDEKQLDKVASRKNLESTLADIASEEQTFLLKDRRNIETDKSTKNTFELSLFTYKKEINEAYRIYKIQDRRTMSDIEPFISESESVMEEYIFGRDKLKDNDIRTISIEIDLDALSLFILGKSHIFELQSGKPLEEIEKILEDAEIKHL